MNEYVVLYREKGQRPRTGPLAFLCQADDTDHAEEQCQDANPDCDIVWATLGSDVQEALDDYWGIGG